MHHIQGEGADFYAVTRELAEALHEGYSIEVTEDILALLFAGTEMSQLAISLSRCDIAQVRQTACELMKASIAILQSKVYCNLSTHLLTNSNEQS